MRFLFIASLLLILTGCITANKADNIAPAAKKGGLFGLSTVDGIELTGGQAVKGEKNVAIPYFRIAFYTENNPGGYSNGSGDKTIIHSTLVGVNSDVLQRVTDMAYKNFTAQMNAKGFNVLPISALNKSSTYRAIKQTKTQYKDEALFGPDAIFVSPTGMRVSDASIFRLQEANNILREMNASIIDVTLYVTYLSQSLSKAAGFIVTGVNVGQASTVIPGSNIQFYGLQASKCNGFCPNTVARTKLGQPIFNTEKVGKLTDVTTSGDKAGDVAITALSWLTTGTKIRSTTRFELRADPKKYEKVVTNVLSKATDKLVNSIATNH